jgi:hypothetical protein
MKDAVVVFDIILVYLFDDDHERRSTSEAAIRD